MNATKIILLNSQYLSSNIFKNFLVGMRYVKNVFPFNFYQQKKIVRLLKVNMSFFRSVSSGSLLVEDFKTLDPRRVEERLKSLKKLKQMYLEASKDEFNTREECIFSQKFLNLLQKELGDSKTFKLLSEKEQDQIADRVQKLLIPQTRPTFLFSGVGCEDKMTILMFSTEYKKFNADFLNSFFVPENETHSRKLSKKYGDAKVKDFCLGFLNYLINNDQRFSKITLDQIKKIDFNSLVDKLKPDFLFDQLVKISIKRVIRQSLNIHDNATGAFQSQLYDEVFFYVKATDLRYKMQQIISTFLANRALELLETTYLNKPLWDNPSERMDFVVKFLRKHKSKFLHEKNKKGQKYAWYLLSSDIARIVHEIFAVSGMVLKSENIRQPGSVKSHKIYWLNHKIQNIVPLSDQLPRITPPKKLNVNTDDFVQNSPKGPSKALISEEAVRALNIAQEKKLEVNPFYLDIMALIHNSRNKFNLETPFPTRHDFNRQIEIVKAALTRLGTHVLQHPTAEKACNYFSTHLEVANISLFVKDPIYEKRKLQKETQILKSKRQLLQTSLTLADLFKGFPLYYGTKVDFRGRMYPLEYFLSRINGELKHLLQDAESRIINLKGMINLLTGYYRYSLDCTVKFKEYIQNPKNKNFIALKQFFLQHKKLCEETSYFKNQVCYWLNLENNLLDIFENNNRYSKIQLEIDQKSSSFTILCLMLGLDSMAPAVNLKGGAPQDIYGTLMKKIPEFLEKKQFKMPDKDMYAERDKNRVLTFLTKDRASFKSVAMKWSYGEAHYNRCKSLLKKFKEFHCSRYTEKEYHIINNFAKLFDTFLDEQFPTLAKRKKILIEVLKLRIDATAFSDVPAINVRNLDGCVFTWDFSAVDSVSKSYYNPITRESDSYKINFESESSKALKKRRDNLLRSFLANFIQMIDGSLMRMFIVKMYDKTEYRLGHIHDAAQMHPNYVDDFYDVVTDVYISIDWSTLISKLFFEPMKEGMTDEIQAQIVKLEEKFYKSFTPVVVEKGVFNPHHAYELEGSVKSIDIWEREQEFANPDSKVEDYIIH